MIKRLITYLVLICLALLFAGCKGEVVANVATQREANQIVALFNSYGITASVSSEAAGRGQYAVLVDPSYVVQAQSLLAEKDMPRKPEISLLDIISQQGIMPNSRKIEALRLDHALALELESLLEAIPMIARAEVVVRSNLLEADQKPGVSVVLETYRGQLLPVDQVNLLIQRILPNVPSDNLSIVVADQSVQEPLNINVGSQNSEGKLIAVPLVPFLKTWRVPQADYNGLALTLLGMLCAAMLVGGLVGYWFTLYRQSQHLLTTRLPDIKRGDRLKKELPEG